jgi:hypothetical protein
LRVGGASSLQPPTALRLPHPRFQHALLHTYPRRRPHPHPTLQGDGKTTSVRAWAHANPFLIYVDLDRKNSYSNGVNALAEAIGYATSLTPEEERARSSGKKFPKLDDFGEEDLEKILDLYKRACRELRDEDKLGGRGVPTLVLDHSTRPLTEIGRDALGLVRKLYVDDLDAPQQPPRAVHKETLIRVFLDAAKDLQGECLLCMVTSDVFAEQGAIRRESCGGGRGSAAFGSAVRAVRTCRARAACVLVGGAQAVLHCVVQRAAGSTVLFGAAGLVSATRFCAAVPDTCSVAPHRHWSPPLARARCACSGLLVG